MHCLTFVCALPLSRQHDGQTQNLNKSPPKAPLKKTNAGSSSSTRATPMIKWLWRWWSKSVSQSVLKSQLLRKSMGADRVCFTPSDASLCALDRQLNSFNICERSCERRRKQIGLGCRAKNMGNWLRTLQVAETAMRCATGELQLPRVSFGFSRAHVQHFKTAWEKRACITLPWANQAQRRLQHTQLVEQTRAHTHAHAHLCLYPAFTGKYLCEWESLVRGEVAPVLHCLSAPLVGSILFS